MADKFVKLAQLGRFLDNVKERFVQKDGAKVLSTNDYTTAEKDKLAGLKSYTAGANITISGEGQITATVPTGADQIAYGDKTVKDVLDDLNYVPVSIKSFTNNVGTVERGTTVTDVTFNWSLGGNPTKVTFGRDDVSLDLSGTKTLTKQTIATNTEWALYATDARNATANKKTGVYFKDKKYWGVGSPANADAVDSAFILGLAGKSFADNYKGDFTVTAGEGKYIFFAVPATFGNAPAFFVGGFEGGFALYKTFDFTNASGATVSYNVFKSTNAGLGATTVTVK